jgi:predicted nucleic acid-binding protein
MSAATLVDTNVLVYRFDARFPEKQQIATDVLRAGLADGFMRVPHQAVLELVAALTRPPSGGEPIMPRGEALREAEELLGEFDVLYPDEEVLRLALRGAAAYQLSWFDAHMWAYAERFGIGELLSEDFQHGRVYGTVRVRDPFV